MALLSKEAILSVLLVYFFSNFGQKRNLFALLMKIYHLTDSFICYANSILSPEYFQFNSLKNQSSSEEGSDNKEFKPEPKYEDKYLEDIKKLNKEYIFNEEEEGVKLEKYTEFVTTLKENKLVLFLNKLSEIDEKLKTYEKVDDDYFVCDSEDEDFEEQNKILLEERANNEEQTKILLEEKANVQFEYNKLITYLDSNEGKEEIMKDATDLATKYVINQRLEKLKNCFVLEKTPLGNVLMIYNNTRDSFSYYSDGAVPYRYLETVARKYVKTFNCGQVFVNMDEELKMAEEKWELERLEKERKDEEEKKKIEELKSKNVHVPQKKSVFTKFKSYNKDSSATKSMAPPPKNSIPNKKLTTEQENEKLILKDKANRYTYEGKLSNFNFLKKVERKVVDKKYALSFADFKKLQKK
jgi:hypothetical protein